MMVTHTYISTDIPFDTKTNNNIIKPNNSTKEQIYRTKKNKTKKKNRYTYKKKRKKR